MKYNKLERIFCAIGERGIVDNSHIPIENLQARVYRLEVLTLRIRNIVARSFDGELHPMVTLILNKIDQELGI